jgi:hypothetical protein
MDPVLSSLFPVHQIGSDGFNWWIGQIESSKNSDPKNSGRYRVRIVGQHLKTCDATPTEELPWANVMMPVTTPWSDGGVTGASVNLNQGNWVVGFYLDNDKQKPIIMGSVGHTAGATLLKNVEEDPTPGETCKSFTTFLSPDRDPYKHEPLPDKDKTNAPAATTAATTTAGDKPTTIGQAGLPANAVPEKHAANFYALFAENSETNPNGAKICVEIADPKCGTESDLKGGLTNILGGMLAANQQSGGQLGDFYVSKVSGELTRYLDVGRYHANRAIRLVKSFIARVKGELIKLIRKGVDFLIENALTVEKAAEDALGNVNTGPVAPDLGIEPFQPIVKRESRLKSIQEFLDKTLAELGCSIEDITDRIAQWLTDLLLGFLMDAFNAAACLVDTLVNGIINQLVSLLETLISSVLGPLQAILSIAAAPLNLIGSAINTVLGLLGISCDGPAEQCQKIKKECTECDTEETEDWLDKLINQIEDGESAGDSVCSEAKKFPTIRKTNVVAVGGVFTPAPGSNIPGTTTTGPGPGRGGTSGGGGITTSTVNSISYSCSDITVTEGNFAVFTITRAGNTLFTSSLSYTITDLTAKYNEDYTGAVIGTVGFARGERSKTIQLRTFRDKKVEGVEEFQLVLVPSSTPVGITPRFPDGNTFKCAITDFKNNNYAPVVGSTPSIPPQTTTVVPIQPILLTPRTNPSTKIYRIISDKPYYYGGEVITFTINTTNVPNNTVLNYEVDGSITAADITESLTGQVTIINNTATLKFSTVDDTDVANETLTLSLLNTPAFKTVSIIADDLPTYDVVADRTVAEDGDTITYTITTANVSNGTTLNYTLSGDVDRLDIIGYSLVGSFVIQNNEATVQIQLTKDGSIEETELLTFTIDNTTASVDVIVLPDLEVITDPDLTRVTVSTDKLNYDEGETITYTITTNNIPDGTIFQYSLFGEAITPSDISGGSLYGTFTILNNQAKVYIGIEDDTQVEKDETLTFSVNGTGASAQVIVNTDPSDKIEDDSDIAVPCVTPPTFGTPITDANGSIISIPIVERGCPYQTPPTIIISGNGYGSRAIPLLDNKGYVTEVRLTKTGTNYLKNLPDPNLRCVIDSFTLLNPGRDYTSAPKVIINGEKDLAEALVNSDGYVYSVRILDRSKEYYEIPSIIIQGGGGSGARVLPNIVCKDPLELESIGYAKIGTGKYIDCP